MIRLKQIIISHWLAIIFAVLLSLLVAFPQVYFRFEHRNDGVYQGIELLPDSPWSPRVREIQDGHGLGSIYQKDGKDNPTIFPLLSSMVVAYLGQIFALDINNTLLLSRLVLPFIVFLLIYSFVFLISKRKQIALSGASVLLFADSILGFSGLSAMLYGVSPDNFLRLARPVNPAMIYIFLFSFLISFWVFYRDKKWIFGVASVIFLGLNFYNYFYTWTYLYAFGALLLLLLAIKKEWREVFRIGAVFLGALIVATPYFLNAYRASLFPTFEEVGLRNGLILTHQPLFIGLTSIAVLLVFLFFFPREDKDKYLFGLAIVLTPFVTLNQQILTGKIVEPDHYHWFFHKPLGVIFVLITIFCLLDRLNSTFYKKALVSVILMASVATGVFVQVSSYYYDRRDGGNIAIERQRYGPVMKWLAEKAPKEAVVFANNEISHLTVIYTPLNVFYHRAASFSSFFATEARQQEILFSFFRLRRVGAETAMEAFSQSINQVSSDLYGTYYRKFLGTYEEMPKEKLQEVVGLYQKTLSVPTAAWLYEIWKKYEVEYLVWDKKTDPLWRLDQYKYLKKVAEFGDIAIYQFIP